MRSGSATVWDTWSGPTGWGGGTQVWWLNRKKGSRTSNDVTTSSTTDTANRWTRSIAARSLRSPRLAPRGSAPRRAWTPASMAMSSAHPISSRVVSWRTAMFAGPSPTARTSWPPTTWARCRWRHEPASRCRHGSGRRASSRCWPGPALPNRSRPRTTGYRRALICLGCPESRRRALLFLVCVPAPLDGDVVGLEVALVLLDPVRFQVSPTRIWGREPRPSRTRSGPSRMAITTKGR